MEERVMFPLRKSKAYTLSELLVVVILLGVLAAVAVPKYVRVLESRKTTEAEAFLEAVRTEQEQRCVFGKDYKGDLKDVKVATTAGQSKQYEYRLLKKGIAAQSQSRDYTLRLPSYKDGRMCCEGSYCASLNKAYPSCEELTAALKVEDECTADVEEGCQDNPNQAKCCTDQEKWEGGKCVAKSFCELNPGECACNAYQEKCCTDEQKWDGKKCVAKTFCELNPDDCKCNADQEKCCDKDTQKWNGKTCVAKTACERDDQKNTCACQTYYDAHPGECDPNSCEAKPDQEKCCDDKTQNWDGSKCVDKEACEREDQKNTCACGTYAAEHPCECEDTKNTCACDTYKEANPCECDDTKNTCACETYRDAHACECEETKNTCACETYRDANPCECDDTKNTCACDTYKENNPCDCDDTKTTCACKTYADENACECDPSADTCCSQAEIDGGMIFNPSSSSCACPEGQPWTDNSYCATDCGPELTPDTKDCDCGVQTAAYECNDKTGTWLFKEYGECTPTPDRANSCDTCTTYKQDHLCDCDPCTENCCDDPLAQYWDGAQCLYSEDGEPPVKTQDCECGKQTASFVWNKVSGVWDFESWSECDNSLADTCQCPAYAEANKCECDASYAAANKCECDSSYAQANKCECDASYAQQNACECSPSAATCCGPNQDYVNGQCVDKDPCTNPATKNTCQCETYKNTHVCECSPNSCACPTYAAAYPCDCPATKNTCQCWSYRQNHPCECAPTSCSCPTYAAAYPCECPATKNTCACETYRKKFPCACNSNSCDCPTFVEDNPCYCPATKNTCQCPTYAEAHPCECKPNSCDCPTYAAAYPYQCGAQHRCRWVKGRKFGADFKGTTITCSALANSLCVSSGDTTGCRDLMSTYASQNGGTSTSFLYLGNENSPLPNGTKYSSTGAACSSSNPCKTINNTGNICGTYPASCAACCSGDLCNYNTMSPQPCPVAGWINEDEYVCAGVVTQCTKWGLYEAVCVCD